MKYDWFTEIVVVEPVRAVFHIINGQLMGPGGLMKLEAPP